MSTTLTAILLGLVEGLTEFLPVSSTGHLLLAERWLPHQSDLFNTVIQSGAVLAVFVLFAGEVMDLARNLHVPHKRAYVLQVALAFGITAVGGVAMKKLGLKLPETTRPVALATLVGGVLFLAVEAAVARRGARPAPNGWTLAVAMGCGQLLAAAFPGASRSGSTILLGLLLGAGRPEATAFSFLLGVPTLLAAGGLQVVEALRDGVHEPLAPLLLASAVAALSAFATVRWLLGYVRGHTFVPFALYRIALGAALLWGPLAAGTA